MALAQDELKNFAAAPSMYDPSSAIMTYAKYWTPTQSGLDYSVQNTAAAHQLMAMAQANKAAGNGTPNSVSGSGPCSSSSSVGPYGAPQGYPFVHSTTGPGAGAKKKAQPVPINQKDQAYWDRRRRNNESARRSREARKMKEETVQFRVVMLERENLQLKAESQMLRQEIEQMRMLFYNTANSIQQQQQQQQQQQ